jgi:hypothetical protein
MSQIAPQIEASPAVTPDGRAPSQPITHDERDRWHADADIRRLLNQASARGLHDLDATVESLRALERRL